jgi:hypothetical protein
MTPAVAFVPVGARPEAEGDIVLHGQPWKQGRLLEYDAAVRSGSRDWRAVDGDLTARRGVETREEIEQGGFSASAGTDNANELLVGNVERDAGLRLHVAVAARERLADSAYANSGHRTFLGGSTQADDCVRQRRDGHRQSPAVRC